MVETTAVFLPAEPKTLVLDPRKFPLSSTGALPNLVRIGRTSGEITANEDGCAQAGISADELNQSLQTLNLASKRLCLKRKQVWEKLASLFDPDTTTAEEVKAALMPDDKGFLVMFWSTWRCYFGGLAEEVLDHAEVKAALC